MTTKSELTQLSEQDQRRWKAYKYLLKKRPNTYKIQRSGVNRFATGETCYFLKLMEFVKRRAHAAGPPYDFASSRRLSETWDWHCIDWIKVPYEK